MMLRWAADTLVPGAVELLVLVTLLRSVGSMCPSDVCSCDDAVLSVVCVSADLDLVPYTLNPGIRSMDLSRNRIRTLRNAIGMYAEIQELYIQGNRIEDLGRHNFEAQHKLVILDLSDNKIEYLGPASLAGLESIKQLNLANNRLREISSDALSFVPTLMVLNLSGNRLKTLHKDTFSRQSELYELSLRGNKISDICSTAALRPLKSLFVLDLSSNPLDLNPDCFAPLVRLEKLSINEIGLEVIPDLLFRSLNHLKVLRLQANKVTDPCSSLKHLPVLEELYLGGNPFFEFRENCFEDVRQLRVLEASTCSNFSRVNVNAFASTPNLEAVIMDHNRQLTGFSVGVFNELSRLEQLALANCSITTIARDSLPIPGLKSLSLQNNPIVCNCSLSWFVRSMVPSNESRISLDRIVCVYPARLEGTQLRDLSVEELGCGLSSQPVVFLLAAVIMLGALFCAFFIAFALWKYRQRMHAGHIAPGEKQLSQCHYFPSSVYCISQMNGEIHRQDCPNKWGNVNGNQQWSPQEGSPSHIQHHPLCYRHHLRHPPFPLHGTSCPTSASADDFLYESQASNRSQTLEGL